jgi:hypothetical protein
MLMLCENLIDFHCGWRSVGTCEISSRDEIHVVVSVAIVVRHRIEATYPRNGVEAETCYETSPMTG